LDQTRDAPRKELHGARNCYLASPYMDLTLSQPFNMSEQTVKSPLITRAQPTVRTDIIQIVRSFNHLLKSHESIFTVDLKIIADRNPIHFTTLRIDGENHAIQKIVMRQYARINRHQPRLCP